MSIDYLPSKRVLLLLVVVILVGGYLFYAEKVRENKPVTPNRPLAALSLSPALKDDKEFSKDTDGDGLKDWEERLWQTDLDNPDTDGDGASDNDEINAKRNPRLARTGGKNDQFGGKSITHLAGEQPPEDANKTEALAHDLFSAYMLIKQQSGGDLQPQQIEQLSQAFAQRAAGSYAPHIYTKKDLKIGTDSSSGALQSYASALVVIFKDTTAQDTKTLAVMKDFLSTANNEKLKNLEPSITFHQKTQEKLQTLPVPSEMSDIHLVLLNGTAEMAYLLSGIMNAPTDPVSGVAALGRFEPVRRLLGETLVAAGNYFTNKSAIPTP